MDIRNQGNFLNPGNWPEARILSTKIIDVFVLHGKWMFYFFFAGFYGLSLVHRPTLRYVYLYTVIYEIEADIEELNALNREFSLEGIGLKANWAIKTGPG